MLKKEDWFIKKTVNRYGEDRTVETFRGGKLAIWIVLGLIALIFIFGSFRIIDAGDRGVKVRLGNVVGTLEPGLYFKLPFIDQIHSIDVRTQGVIYERENPLTAASSDLQDVNVAVVVNYHVDPVKVADLYKQYRTLENHEEIVIRPIVRDTVKAISAQYEAGQLVTKRAEFAGKVATLLNERLNGKFIVVEQSNVTDIKFSPEFSKAIEAKVTAVQNAEASKNKLEQIKYDAQQTIETAKAQAEAIRIQAEAINSQGGADYVALQKIKAWDGHSCVSYCGLDAMFITPGK
jgi:regulator of protease activity HflC (stomatin/prohibitin superfamily)